MVQSLDLEIKHVCNVDSQVLIYLDRADASLPAATVRLRTPGERGSLVINCRASSLYKLSQQGDKACTKITSDSTVGDAQLSSCISQRDMPELYSTCETSD